MALKGSRGVPQNNTPQLVMTMSYDNGSFVPFKMRTPTNIKGVERVMLVAANKANRKGCVVLVGIRPSHKTWKEVVPLVFSPENLSEATTTVNGTIERVRNRFFLVGNIFPEVQIYLLNGAYTGNLLCSGVWRGELPEPLKSIIHNLHNSIIESGVVKSS